MPGCVLHVTGADLDSASVLAGTGLEPYHQHRPGDLQTLGRNKGQPWGGGGFKLDASRSDDLEQQIRDVIVFLRGNFDALRSALSGPAVDDALLDFGHCFRLADRAYAEFRLPPELLRLAADLGIGIKLSIYPTSDEH